MNLIEHFVNGKIIPGSSDRKGKVFNPATGEQESEVRLASKSDLDQAVEAAKKAFEDSNKKPEDLDLIEVHDNFTISEIIALEEIGIFKRGEAAQKSLDGETKLGGVIPTTVSYTHLTRPTNREV